MTINQHLAVDMPYLRVRDRDAHIAFFQDVFGFRLLTEENSMAIMGDASLTPRLTIEESPETRTRAVEGVKKLDTLVFRVTNPDEVAHLLARRLPVETVYQGRLGYGFAAVAPGGDRILIHSEDDASYLMAIPRPELPAQPDFEGLTDVLLDRVVLNSPDQAASQAFYDLVFEGQSPLGLVIQQAYGPDLATSADEVWDLESLAFQVSADYDLLALKDRLEAAGHSVFVTSKGKVLVASDPSQIELWLSK